MSDEFGKRFQKKYNLQAGQVFQQPDPQVIPMPNPAFQRGMVVNNTDIIR